MFYVQTENPKINQAADDAERFFKSLAAGNIALPDFFTHTSDTPEMLRQRIAAAVGSAGVPVREYTSSWFFRNVLGYYKNGAIFVNTRFSSRASVAEAAGNLAHEYCHALGYKHKGNKVTAYNLKSVPYVIGYSCRDFVRNGF